MAIVQVWRQVGEARLAAAKGAPEAIFRLCKLPDAEVARLTAVVSKFAAQGLRVLGVASSQVDKAFPDPEAADFVLMEKNLMVLVDGIREGRKTFSNTLKYILINFITIKYNY